MSGWHEGRGYITAVIPELIPSLACNTPKIPLCITNDNTHGNPQFIIQQGYIRAPRDKLIRFDGRLTKWPICITVIVIASTTQGRFLVCYPSHSASKLWVHWIFHYGHMFGNWLTGNSSLSGYQLRTIASFHTYLLALKKHYNQFLIP